MFASLVLSSENCEWEALILPAWPLLLLELLPPGFWPMAEFAMKPPFYYVGYRSAPLSAMDMPVFVGLTT